jgi:superfamily I DNA/RNA helicase/mRNA-degrading endonuclease RelE of RelBE toxin-antitoxin system
MTDQSKVKVAISSEFLEAFAKIPKSQQNKVQHFVTKFMIDPMSPGINYEKIKGAADPNIRSVRIDLAYRGIVLKPDTNNVVLLLWVDHHDDAYAWAEKKIWKVNKATGSIQLIEKVESEQPIVKTVQSKGLFDEYKDKHLVKLGVPEELFPIIRKIQSDDELDKHSRDLPQEVSEALYMLAAGFSLEEVYLELGKSEEQVEINPDDFVKALQNPDSQRRFVVIENEEELAEMLEAPLEKWRVFLHPSQKKIVSSNFSGPVRVLGGAGTGKTVVLIHRAKYLAQFVFNKPEDKILVTTFTKNLAADINSLLSSICPDEVFKRIEVINLDQWVGNLLKKSGYSYSIDYGPKLNDAWEDALQLKPKEPMLDDQFYKAEWEEVIQAQDVSSFDEYAQIKRIGRGTKLNRTERKAIWPVFEEYRIMLNNKKLREAQDAQRDALALLKEGATAARYSAILVDEAQDMTPQAFKLLRQIIPAEKHNDLFIVGDAHQRIYRHKVTLGRLGINIRGRSRKLYLNYRTTEETRKWAVSLLNGISVDDLDDGTDNQKGYRSLYNGEKPLVRSHNSFKEEINWLAGEINKITNLSNTCVVLRTNNMCDEYAAALESKGLKVYKVRRSEAEDRRQDGVRVATMHRVKGLEFDNVFIAGLNSDIVPPYQSIEAASDQGEVDDIILREKCLLFVSATRAKKNLFISSSDEMSKLVKAVKP